IGCQRDLFRFNGADVVALGSLGLDDLVGAAPLKAGELGYTVFVGDLDAADFVVIDGDHLELGAGQADVAALVGLDDRDGAGLLLGLHLDGDVLLAAVDGYRDGFIQRLIACGSLYFLNVVGLGDQVRQNHLAGSVSGAVVENRSIGTGAHHLEAGAGHRLVIVVDLQYREIAGCVFRVVPDIREVLLLVLDPEHTLGGQVVARHGLLLCNPVLDRVQTGRSLVGQGHGDLPVIDFYACTVIGGTVPQHLHAVRINVVMLRHIEGGGDADLGFDVLGQLGDEIIDVVTVFGADSKEGIGI